MQTSALETSVAGRDLNRDHVRDDIAEAIHQRYHGDQATALAVYAQALQLLLLAETPWQDREGQRLEASAAACLRLSFPKDWVNLRARLGSAVLNTPTRLDAMKATRARLARSGKPAAPASCGVVARPDQSPG